MGEAAPYISYEAFLGTADEDVPAEWVDGKVILTGSSSSRHQQILGFLLTSLAVFAEERTSGTVRSRPFQMKMGATFTFVMNKKSWIRIISLTIVIFALAACDRGAQPSVSAVGSWQGTLTTLSGDSGTQPFTVEINRVDSETGSYEGSLNVGTETYRASGGYNPYISEDHFALRVALAEMGPALSPGPPFYGIEWYGEMTENSWEGEWYLRTEDGEEEREGTFSLERVP